MGSPVCLSQHYVNKQNIRSYSNIIGNLLKGEDNTALLQNVFEFEEKSLVSELSSNLIDIMCTIKRNLRHKSKDDFKDLFSDIKRSNELSPVEKSDILACCLSALNEIIPRSFFGRNHNMKIFKKLMQTVIYSMKRQHFMIEKAIAKWDFTIQPWISIEEKLSKDCLIKILTWIIRNVLAAMISLNFYVTTCKLDADENKLYFFWKNLWQSFYDKKISNMTFTKVLKRYDPYCLGSKTKKNHTFSERLKLKSLKKEIPKLHLVLKPKMDCRPIVRYKSDQNAPSTYKMRERFNFLKTLTGKAHKKIETQFNTIYQQWLHFKQPKLYFIKTDLSNAFGSINREKLIKIMYEKHTNFQKTEKSMYLKQKMAQQYKEMMLELRKPLLVRAGNTVYEWNEGLVQGYKYSPALSELYYTYLDDLYFSQHLKKSEENIRYFIRVVDDYLYITDSLEDAYLFLKALSRYRNVNYEKTVVNFDHENIKFSNEMTFLGYSYDTKKLQVSRANNVFIGQMCYKIAFSSALENLNKFMENRIGQSGIQINSHIFNFIHNSEELIWKHVFTTFCLSANKFCTILAVLCEEREMKYYLNVYKKRVAVKLSNSIIETLMKNKPTDFLFMFCINHFRYISFKALYLCAKHTPKCSGLVPFINDEMAKSNCLFGKWKEHACRIETNGELRRKAIEQVCRRTDLRMIVKKFDTLPNGFQCYNHKKLL